jgi:hypothetical protein
MIDRLRRNVRTGHFERMTCAATAAAAATLGAEIYFEHYRASFGNKWMWSPVVVSAPMTVAAIAGVFSKRAAKTVLPVTSAFVLANGIQGTYLHIRGIGRKPGGWDNGFYNVIMGPPVFAPMSFAAVGGLGVLAAILRRER